MKKSKLLLILLVILGINLLPGCINHFEGRYGISCYEQSSAADLKAQQAIKDLGFKGNTFVIGVGTNMVTFYNNTKPLITVKYSDFQKMGGK